MKRLFKGAVIITANENFDIIYNGMLGIKGNEIVYVGEYSSEFEKGFDADSIIHANNKVLMPGLINMHTHLPMTLFRGYASDMALDEWLREKILPAEEKMSAADVEIGTRIACAEMILSGTTMCLDMYMHADKIANVIYDMGLRGAVSYSYNDDSAIEKAMSLTEHCKTLEGGKLRAIASLSLAFDGNDDKQAVEKYINECRENNKRIHFHVADNDAQTKRCKKATGMSPIEYMESLGVFKAKTIAVHCLDISDSDMDILKNNNVSVVYCPTSDAKIASGFAPVDKMLKKGINVCIGTDGGASNNNMDMLEEMHIGSVIAKGISRNPAAMNAQETIKMATINGAKALGIDNILGSLEKGKKADMIMFNHSSPFFLPKSELCNNIVYSASRNELEMTMVDGKTLMERGQLLNNNYERLAAGFEEAAARLTDKENE
ncbi:MAG: amidohydrolase [Eubacteriales bacterium]